VEAQQVETTAVELPLGDAFQTLQPMILRDYTFTSAFLISHTQKNLMCKK